MDYTVTNKALEAYKSGHQIEKKFFQGGVEAAECLRMVLDRALEVSDSTFAFWHFQPTVNGDTWLFSTDMVVSADEFRAWEEVVALAYQESSPTLLHYPASMVPSGSAADVPMVHWPITIEQKTIAVLILSRESKPYLPEVLPSLEPLLRAAWQILREVNRQRYLDTSNDLLNKEDLTNWASYLEQTEDAYFLVDKTSQVLDCSSGSLGLLGLFKTQMVQKSLINFIHEPDQILLSKALLREKKDSFFLDTRVHTSKGETKVVQWKVTPHPEGHLWYLMARDISEDYHSRLALEKSRSYAEQLITALPDGVVLINPGGVHLDVNPAFERMTGFTAEELKGATPPYPYWPKENSESIQAAFERTMEGDFEEFELVFQRKNGEKFPVLVHPSQMLDVDGQAVTYYATVKDNTQQQLVLEQVKENEYRFRQLVMNSPLAIIIHSEDVIRFCNPAAVFLFKGRQLSKFIGQPLSQFLHNPEEELAPRLDKLSSQKGSQTVEEKFVSVQGKVLDLEVTSHQVSFEGKPAYQAIFRDITERKQAMLALKESEERNRFLVESVPHVIWTASQPGQIETCNRSGQQFLRTSISEILAQGWLPFVHPNDRVKMETTWATATSSQTQYRVKYRLGNPDADNWRWVQEEAVPMKNEQGELVRWYGIATDIHEQVLAENALTKREAFLNSLVQSQTTFLVRLDTAGIFQFVNEAFRKRFHSRAPLLGKSGIDLVLEEDQHAWSKVLKQCLEKPGKPISIQLRQPQSNHEVIWTAWEFVGLESHDGKVREVQGVGNEITQQKKAEARIEEERKKLINITNSVPGVVYQFRLLPDGDFSYDFVSESIHDLFDFPKGKAFHFPDLFSDLPDEQREEIASLIKESAESMKPWKYEFNLRMSNGQYIWLLNQAIPEPRLPDGSIRWNGILTDISEQKALKVLLDDTSRIAKVGGWELTLPAQTLNWTDETYRIHEIPTGKNMTLQKALGHYSPKYQPIMEEALEKTQKEGGSFDITAQLTTAKGNTIWVRSQGRAITQGNRITRLMGTLQDVTISQEIEVRLRESEAILRTSLEHSLVSNVLLSMECNILYIDQRTRNQLNYLTGTEPEIGDWFPQFLPIDEVDNFEENFALAYKGETVHRERQINYASQDPFWVEMVLRPVMHDQGDTASAVVYSFQNITQRKLAEQENQKLAMVAENTDNLVIIMNPQGYIEWANDAFVTLSGYSLEEVSGHQPGLFLFGSQSDPEVISTLEEALVLNQKVKAELEQVSKQGKPYWVELDMEPILDQDHKVIHFILLENNITERKLAEKAIWEQNEELKKTNQELDTFVYRVSHDLRAPLVSSLGLIDLTLQEDNPDVIKQYMGLQQKSLSKLDNFIQDILSYSRNTRLEIVPESISFGELIGGIFDQLNYIESYKAIERVVEINYNEDFYSDQGRLHVVLSNLISNALKFSRHHLAGAFVRVHVSGDPEWVEILVVDNGQGIPDEHVDKIFKMFYRATDRQSGSGLGLYIVKETIEKLGGAIEVSSKMNEGTTFQITLPNLKSKEKK